jgi:hypothetical protein
MERSAEYFERFEYKFWAPRARVEAALAPSEAFMEQDAAALVAGASQLNTSLYFDSPRFTLLEQHLSGAPDRLKLRVRYYGETPKGDCFFEIKRRQVAVVMKKRAVVKVEHARRIVDDMTAAFALGNPTLDLFQYLSVRFQVRPRILVRAARRAFRAKDSYVDTRLTIDDHMSWQPVRLCDPLTPDASAWRRMPEGTANDHVLVEVKFRDVRPWWLGQVVGALAPYRLSFSKYVSAATAARRDPFFTMDAA